MIGYIDSMGWNSSVNKEEIMKTRIKLASALSDVQKNIKKLNSQYIIYKDKPTRSR
jgi:hypothetical protein